MPQLEFELRKLRKAGKEEEAEAIERRIAERQSASEMDRAWLSERAIEDKDRWGHMQRQGAKEPLPGSLAYAERPAGATQKQALALDGQEKSMAQMQFEIRKLRQDGSHEAADELELVMRNKEASISDHRASRAVAEREWAEAGNQEKAGARRVVTSYSHPAEHKHHTYGTDHHHSRSLAVHHPYGSQPIERHEAGHHRSWHRAPGAQETCPLTTPQLEFEIRQMQQRGRQDEADRLAAVLDARHKTCRIGRSVESGLPQKGQPFKVSPAERMQYEPRADRATSRLV